MNWHAQSPDLNVIENCWWKIVTCLQYTSFERTVVKRELQKRIGNINNTQDLENNIRDIWTNLPVIYIQSS